MRPHVGMRVEDPAGRVIQEVDPAPRAQVDIEPGDRAGDPGGAPRRRDGAGRHLLSGLRRLPRRHRRQDRHGRARRFEEDQSWYAALAPYPDPEVVVVATIERGGFGADAAAPAASQILTDYFNVKPDEIDERVRGGGDACTNDRHVTTRASPPPSAGPAARARGRAAARGRSASASARRAAAIGGLDPLLACAAIGIIAFSAYTLGVTTQDDIPGDPYFYVIRQASTRSSGSR